MLTNKIFNASALLMKPIAGKYTNHLVESKIFRQTIEAFQKFIFLVHLSHSLCIRLQM